MLLNQAQGPGSGQTAGIDWDSEWRQSLRRIVLSLSTVYDIIIGSVCDIIYLYQIFHPNPVQQHDNEEKLHQSDWAGITVAYLPSRSKSFSTQRLLALPGGCDCIILPSRIALTALLTLAVEGQGVLSADSADLGTSLSGNLVGVLIRWRRGGAGCRYCANAASRSWWRWQRRCLCGRHALVDRG